VVVIGAAAAAETTSVLAVVLVILILRELPAPHWYKAHAAHLEIQVLCLMTLPTMEMEALLEQFLPDRWSVHFHR
jgi:hypothetical protein